MQNQQRYSIVEAIAGVLIGVVVQFCVGTALTVFVFFAPGIYDGNPLIRFFLSPFRAFFGQFCWIAAIVIPLLLVNALLLYLTFRDSKTSRSISGFQGLAIGILIGLLLYSGCWGYLVTHPLSIGVPSS